VVDDMTNDDICVTTEQRLNGPGSGYYACYLIADELGSVAFDAVDGLKDVDLMF